MKNKRKKRAHATLDGIIGRNIKAERLSRGMTRNEFAKIFGLTLSHVGLIERGERGPNRMLLMKMSQFFGRPIGSFFYEAADLPYHEEME